MDFNKIFDILLAESNEDFVSINLKKIDQNLSKNWTSLPKGEEEKAVKRYWDAELKAKFEGKGEPFKSAKKLAEKAKTVAELKKAVEKVKFEY